MLSNLRLSEYDVVERAGSSPKRPARPAVNRPWAPHERVAGPPRCSSWQTPDGAQATRPITGQRGCGSGGGTRMGIGRRRGLFGYGPGAVALRQSATLATVDVALPVETDVEHDVPGLTDAAPR